MTGTWGEFLEWLSCFAQLPDAESFAADLEKIHEMVNTPAEYRDPWDDDGIPEQ